MNKTNRVLCLVSLLAFSMSAQAARLALQECAHLNSDHPEKAKRYLMCLDGNIELLERERKTWITKLVMDTENLQKETGNSQLLPIIQRSFINQERYMEDACRWRYLKQMPNATLAAKVYKRCKIDFIKQHTLELQADFLVQ
ncbi:hypothetical protein L1285_11820 [Pseudoalteromonas sp. DL2-H2.2]|uniref:Lysozyme inhibitor LprI N-terminal domain-containing protein n=2 Tax=Pseudoalteromonas rubra TaxID=43658 RepID=A0A0F4R0T2_9GAMM|nr:hypothetical protein [Pseudoalteromonas sp. DL2-H2.2]KJZ13130.1 hypothetical protein TW77_02020 [Pseudoalteromonas rubra]MCF2909006.1 hypothetical protein [Pseudoalteromonas sp. DL2-H2.2]